jgi:hypothetical protein
MKSPDASGGFFVLGSYPYKTIVTFNCNSFMHQLIYLLIFFTVVLCLAAMVIIVLNKTVNRLQKENTRLTLKINRPHSLGKEKALNTDETRWQQIDPLRVAKQVYDSGITSLN